MKKFIKEIEKGIDLEKNLPQYGSYLMDLYYRKAVTQFAMDYYTYQGMMADHVTEDAFIIDYTKEFHVWIQEYLLPLCVDEKREEGICKIDRLRNKVYNVVEVLSAYADIFSRYEYVLNRCEYRFKEAENVAAGYTDEDFTRDIMNYIFSDEDHAVVNLKISEILSELPIRMTKNKFFELLKNGMSVYEISDKATIDDFIYDIRSSALMVFPEGMAHYEVLADIWQMLQKTDYSDISQEDWKKCTQALHYAADMISKATNLFMLLQGLINKGYAMLIAAPYVGEPVRETENAANIIAKLHENFYNEDCLTLEEEITDSFIFMEGIPEELDNILQSVEYVLDGVRKNHTKIVKSILSDGIYLGLFLCEKLLSDSLFVDLSGEYALFEEESDGTGKDTGEDQTDTKEYLAQKTKELTQELAAGLKTQPKLLGKSIMSLILSKLPVYFNNLTELQDYVYYSLSGCTNKAEKAACIEIIKGIMEN